MLDLVGRLTREGRHSLSEALEIIVASLGRSSLPWAGAVRAIGRDPAAFGLVDRP